MKEGLINYYKKAVSSGKWDTKQASNPDAYIASFDAVLVYLDHYDLSPGVAGDPSRSAPVWDEERRVWDIFLESPREKNPAVLSLTDRGVDISWLKSTSVPLEGTAAVADATDSVSFYGNQISGQITDVLTSGDTVETVGTFFSPDGISLSNGGITRFPPNASAADKLKICFIAHDVAYSNASIRLHSGNYSK